MLEIKHYIGLDLGQVSDYTALVILRREREVPELPKPRAVTDWRELDAPRPPSAPAPARYICNAAERFPPGIPPDGYVTLVENMVQLFQDPRFAGAPLVVDGTGVGRPVVDMFRKAKINCRLVPVTITGGASAATLGQVNVDEFGYWHVPKKELVGCVQVLLGTNRLEVSPRLPHAAVLGRELKNFSYKINQQTAHVSFEAWRQADHDDIVLGLALAAWYGQFGSKELWAR